VKLRPGGQIEVEFVGQALQLIHARTRPEVCHTTLRVALRRLAEAGALPVADAALLIHADHVWRTVQGMLRIVVGRTVGETLADASARPLLAAAAAAGLNAIDAAGLRASLDGLARQVRAVFVRHIGEIGS
jgi:glutamate-ammonia-ligase adenylyltransferase